MVPCYVRNDNYDCAMSTCVIVLGSHRSGTSCVAGILHTLGIDFGDGHLMKATPDNPKGYFEDERFYRLNEIMIGDWRSPDPWTHEDLIAQYEKLIIERSSESELWGIKDPRLCITLKHFFHLFEKHNVTPVIVNVNRNYDSMCSSVHARDNLPMPAARAIHDLYLNQRSSFCNEHSKDVAMYQISFEEVLKHPMHRVRNLANFAFDGLPDLHPSLELQEEASDFVEGKLRHY